MSEKTITDLTLNSITLSNSNYANAQGYTAQSNNLVTNNVGNLLVNNYPVLTQSSFKIISLEGIDETVSPETSTPLPIDLFNYDFLCTEATLCTFTYIAGGSSIYAESIVFNFVDNILTITLNNDGEGDLTITGFFINLYNP